MIGKRRAKGVEVTAVAGKPVHAHYRARIPRIAPFSVDDPMKAVRAETAEVMFAWFGHAGVVAHCTPPQPTAGKKAGPANAPVCARGQPQPQFPFPKYRPRNRMP